MDNKQAKEEVMRVYKERRDRRPSISMKVARELNITVSPLRPVLEKVSLSEAVLFTKIKCNLIMYSLALINRGSCT
jgi:hypothetical protein